MIRPCVIYDDQFLFALERNFHLAFLENLAMSSTKPFAINDLMNGIVCFMLVGAGLFFSCSVLARDDGETTAKVKVSSLCDTGDSVLFACATENRKIMDTSKNIRIFIFAPVTH